MNSPDLFKRGGGLLIVTADNEQRSELHHLLSEHYALLYASSCEKGLYILTECSEMLAAVLITEERAVENGYDFLRQVKASPKLAQTPVIVVCSGPPDENILRCLDEGATDIIRAPFLPKIVVNRIRNAARAKDAMTLGDIERMLKQLPSNFYLKDTECRYVFCTKYWHHLEHPDDPDWTIRGLTDVDVRKDKENAVKAMEADRELLRTGKGTQYVIEINADGVQEFMEVIKQPVYDERGNITGIVGLINDVTQHELLKQELKRASTTDELTGVFNRREIRERIKRGLDAVKESGEDVCLLMFDLDNFKSVNDTYGHNRGDEVLVAFTKVLRDDPALRDREFRAGRWGGEEFMLILRNTPLEEARKVAEQLRADYAVIQLPGMAPQTVSIGVTQARADDSFDALCIRVDGALYQAKDEGKNRVVVR